METRDESRDSANRRALLKSLAAGPLWAMFTQREAFADDTVSAAGMAPDLALSPEPQQANLGSLFPLVERLAVNGDYSYSFLGDRFHSFDEFQSVCREKILDLYGYRPARVDPNPKVIDRADCGDYIREKILFSTTPLFRVPAYVHTPKRLERPAPAIVDLHSHGGMFLFGKEKVIDFGENHPLMKRYHERNYGGRPTTTELVRRGYVVITTDALMFGERRLLLDDDLKHGWDRSRYSLETAEHLNQQCRSKETTLAKSLIYAGMCWPGIVAWDDMRTVDYLLTRPEVDPKRIGCVGVSLGGWRSIFLAGLDNRIAAACITGFMSTVRPMIQRHIDTHSWSHFVPGLHRCLDLPDIAGLMAPKPLLVQQCREDGLFPLAGMQASVDKIAAVYEKVGARDKFSGRFYDGGHRFDIAMQDEAFAWFDKVLRPRS
jgi:dienelactone hydrolase